LAGKLDINFLNGYSPPRDAAFTVLNAASITGTFTSYDLPQLAAGYVWNVQRTPTAFTLTVAGGDYNRDGVVDAADYVLWRNTRNTSVTAGSGADGDGNGLVNDADYTLWQANFGNVRGTVASGAGALEVASVPEPASGLLALSAILLFSALPRRRAASRERKIP
jgi:hypothetical protein